MSWETKITHVEPNTIRVRGYPIQELMGNVSFTEAIYLLYMGELPEREKARLLDAIFVSSVDHGVTPPSVLATRTAASTGAPLNAAIAAGVLSINEYHGGAIQNCMKVIQAALADLAEGEDFPAAAERIVREYLANKKRMPGFGHRYHTADPRTKRLYDLAEETGFAGKGLEMTRAITAAFEREGKKLPVNVDGAIAALLVDLDIPAELANAFFILARVPGLVAHAIEEQRTQAPMRRISAEDHIYTGPELRSIQERME